MNALLAAAALLTQTAAAGPQASPWECRTTNPVIPLLPLLRTHRDRPMGFRSWEFEPEGQRVFGLPATYLLHSRSSDLEMRVAGYHYAAVVEGDIDLVRWLLERVNTDLRCVRNAESYTCLTAEAGGRFERDGLNRMVSILPRDAAVGRRRRRRCRRLVPMGRGDRLKRR